MPARRLSVADIARLKTQGTPIVALTAYSAPMAALLDPYVDILLVGDSLGMVVYGLESTLPVTLDMMMAHGRAVVSASARALVVVDMPFGSYQASPAEAFVACARVLKETGAQAVKLEGGVEMGDTIAFLVKRGIPVMAHIALTPQHVHRFGGYGYRGRTPEERSVIREDAASVEAAGAFAVVLEGLEEELARDITLSSRIATIGIGASPACDGQVLVVDDMLGLSARTARFVRRYADLNGLIKQAAEAYAQDVRSRRFPEPMHCYGVRNANSSEGAL